jgi:ATP-dependent HslUV protease ATP-binding subunit HslU
MERLLEEISDSAPDCAGETISIDAKYVNNSLGELIVNEDLNRYIL